MYDYEYYSTFQKWKYWPNTNTNIIQFEKNDRIRIRISFGLEISIEYEYYLVWRNHPNIFKALLYTLKRIYIYTYMFHALLRTVGAELGGENVERPNNLFFLSFFSFQFLSLLSVWGGVPNDLFECLDFPVFHQLNWFFQNYCMTAKSSNIFLCPKKLLEKSKDKLWISINRNFSEQSVEKKKKKKLTDYRIEGMKRKNKKNKEKRLTKRSKRSTELWNVNFYKSFTQNFTPIKVRK